MTDAASSPAPIAIAGELATGIDTASSPASQSPLPMSTPRDRLTFSFRGSTHVHSPDQLAIWVREPDGGLLQAIPNNPRITLMYRGPRQARELHVVWARPPGRKRRSGSRIYDSSPEAERNRDPERRAERS